MPHEHELSTLDKAFPADDQATDKTAQDSPSIKQKSRRFSPLIQRWQSLTPVWRRVVLACAFLALLLIVTLIILLVVFLRPRSKAYPSIASNGQTDNATASELASPPVRLALLTNFPDPTLYYEAISRTWYAYGTNQASGILDLDRSASDVAHLTLGNLQLATSTDFQTWTLTNSTAADLLPDPGEWVKQGAEDISNVQYHDSQDDEEGDTNVKLSVPRSNVWAPEMLHRPSDDKWVMYYAAANATGDVHCIGAAVGASPKGPFIAGADAIICPQHVGGAIDPSVFVDEANNDTLYLAYKVNGNVRGHGGECNNMKPPQVQTPIMLQRLNDDGVGIDSKFEAVQLLDRIEEDGPLIEAPCLIKAGDYYFLFYSSGCTRDPDYALRYAYASELTGPYTRAEPALLQTPDDKLVAPGSATVRFAYDNNGAGGGSTGNDVGGSWKMALHARVNTTIGGVRAFFTADLAFAETKVVLVNASTSVS